MKMTTLDDFFGQEDERISLGNSLLQKLDALDYDFYESRQILHGEIEVPADVDAELASDIGKFITMEAEKARDEEFANRDTKSFEPIKPAYGDWEGTGHLEGKNFFG
jgi:hypothetical protein